MRRRTALKTLAAIPAAALITGTFSSLPAAAAPLDYPALRARWADILTGRATLDTSDPRYQDPIDAIESAAAAALALIDTSPTRTQVFTDAPLDDNAGVLSTYRRIQSLALAWATPGTSQYEDSDVLDDILEGLRTGFTHGYNPFTPEYGNWWTWEIGVPRALGNTLVLVYAELTPQDIADQCAAIDYYVPDPWFVLPAGSGRKPSTGANRVDLCSAVIVRALLDAETAKLEHARAGLVDAWQIVASGDGFHADGSYLQHTTVPYTGSYGVVLVLRLAQMFALIEPETGGPEEDFYALVEASILPVVYRGQVLDSVRGRAVSRAASRSRTIAADVLEALVLLSGAVPAATADAWLGRARTWLPVLDGAVPLQTVPRVSAIRALEAHSAPPLPEPDGVSLFGGMDRAVVRRPGWAVAISGSSRRIAWYECGNGENERGFHTGSGMTSLYTEDTAHFDDGYWPTVDPYRLPGTTADQTPLPDGVGGQWGAGLPDGEWTGGAVAWPGGDRAALAFGQDLRGPGGTGLRARKAWFAVGGMIVALGADIRSGSGNLVETVVENRNLHYWGENVLEVDGAEPIPGDTSATIHSPSWAHLEDVGGYLFGPGTVLKMLREQRSGSWSQINAGGSTGTILRRFVTMWIWHGAHPPGRAYEYALLPGATSAETAAAAAAPGYQVLANTADHQGVAFGGSTRAVIAWASGTVGEVSLDGPGAVVVDDHDGERVVGVGAHGTGGSSLVVTMPAGPYLAVTDSDGADVTLAAGVLRIEVPRVSPVRQHHIVLET
ncbi:polysaccharide lyase 8 family protein [Ruania rhizosphaerae]|uniref:polysaccharide lyase 8 family protein n=1 Tax=Ruania rhizosphaerae TaxID=1840413 RepID=UPI00135B11F1|nr:polysaccharide lyase 8 family protein [Ruania rhizosphaerae]